MTNYNTPPAPSPPQHNGQVVRNYLATSLRSTQQDTLRQCHRHNQRLILSRDTLYTGFTALRLCCLETPWCPRLQDRPFHIAYTDRSHRSTRKDTGYLRWSIRSIGQPAQSEQRNAPRTAPLTVSSFGTPGSNNAAATEEHREIPLFPGVPNLQFEYQNSLITCTHPLVTWALLAAHLSQTEIIVLADAMLRGTACPVSVTLNDITSFLDAATFPAKRRCTAALPFLGTATDSPMEMRALLALLRHGLPRPQTQWCVYVPDLGQSVVVDMAYPEQRIIIEYDGDAHRIDRRQYHRDERKRQALRSMGYTVIVVFSSDIVRPDQQADFARRVARALQLPTNGTPLAEYRALLDDHRRETTRLRVRRYRATHKARGVRA